MNSKKLSTWMMALLMMGGMALSSRAQDADPTIGPRGFIRLLNAVGIGTGKLDFMIDGSKVRDEGYQFGDVTGGIPRKPASYKMTFRRDGIEAGETKLDVIKDETITLIPFAEFVPATEKQEAYWTIRILRLKQCENREKRTATLVNLTSKPELKVQIQQPDESWITVSIKRLALERAPIPQRTGYVPLKTADGDLKPLSVGTSGNYVSVVYEDAAGTICSQNFQDLKYLSLE